MFDYYYGWHYHMMNINGYKKPDYWHEGIDGMFNIYYGDSPTTKIAIKGGWGIAMRSAYEQLFAMCNVGNDSYRLHASDIIKQFAPLDINASEAKTKTWLTNPLAYDLKSASGSDNVTDWFTRSSNVYGFNLMPNGTRNYWGSENYYDLFKVARFAWFNGSMTLGYEISFYPLNRSLEGRNSPGKNLETNGFDWDTHYGIRMCRPLTTQELGYEIWYVPGLDSQGKVIQEGMPDFKNPYIMHTQNDANGNVQKPPLPNDPSLPLNCDWIRLEPGYLRGFMIHKQRINEDLVCMIM